MLGFPFGVWFRFAGWWFLGSGWSVWWAPGRLPGLITSFVLGRNVQLAAVVAGLQKGCACKEEPMKGDYTGHTVWRRAGKV